MIACHSKHPVTPSNPPPPHPGALGRPFSCFTLESRNHSLNMSHYDKA